MFLGFVRLDWLANSISVYQLQNPKDYNLLGSKQHIDLPPAVENLDISKECGITLLLSSPQRLWDFPVQQNLPAHALQLQQEFNFQTGTAYEFAATTLANTYDDAKPASALPAAAIANTIISFASATKNLVQIQTLKQQAAAMNPEPASVLSGHYLGIAQHPHLLELALAARMMPSPLIERSQKAQPYLVLVRIFITKKRLKLFSLPQYIIH